MSTLKESRKRSACKDESQVWNSATASAVCLQMSSVFWFESLIRLRHIETDGDILRHWPHCFRMQLPARRRKSTPSPRSSRHVVPIGHRFGTDSHRWSQNSTTQRAGWVSDSVRLFEFLSLLHTFDTFAVMCCVTYLRPGRKLTVADSNWKLIASLAWLELWRTHFPFLHTVRFATLL